MLSTDIVETYTVNINPAMNPGIPVIQSGRDPERPIYHRVYTLGDTQILAKYDEGANRYLFRWNTDAPIDFILGMHGYGDPPADLKRPFYPVTVLTLEGTPATEEWVEKLADHLSGSEPVFEEGRTPLFEIMDALRVLELLSSDEAVTVHWNINPDREFLEDQFRNDLSMMAIEANKDSFSLSGVASILAWYFDRFPPYTDNKTPADILVRRLFTSLPHEYME